LVLAAATEEKSHSGVSGGLDSAPEVRPLDQATQSSGGLDVEPAATRLKSVAPELKNSKTQSPVQELGTGFDKRAEANTPQGRHFATLGETAKRVGKGKWRRNVRGKGKKMLKSAAGRRKFRKHTLRENQGTQSHKSGLLGDAAGGSHGKGKWKRNVRGKGKKAISHAQGKKSGEGCWRQGSKEPIRNP
jgi:hypothetical protein